MSTERDNYERPSAPSSNANDLSEMSQNKFETVANFLYSMKRQFDQLSAIQQSMKAELNRVVELEMQIQESLLSAETVLQEQESVMQSNIDNVTYTTPVAEEQNISSVQDVSYKTLLYKKIAKCEPEFVNEIYPVNVENGDDLDEFAQYKKLLSSEVKFKKPKKGRKFKGLFHWQMFRRKNKSQPDIRQNTIYVQTIEPIPVRCFDGQEKEVEETMEDAIEVDENELIPAEEIQEEYHHDTGELSNDGEYNDEMWMNANEIEANEMNADELKRDEDSAIVIERIDLSESAAEYSDKSMDVSNTTDRTVDGTSSDEIRNDIERELVRLDETLMGNDSLNSSDQLDSSSTLDITASISEQQNGKLTDSITPRSSKPNSFTMSTSEFESTANSTASLKTPESGLESLTLPSVTGISQMKYQKPPMYNSQPIECDSLAFQSYVDVPNQDVCRNDMLLITSSPSFLNNPNHNEWPAVVAVETVPPENSLISAEIYHETEYSSTSVKSLQLQSQVETPMASLKLQECRSYLDNDVDEFSVKL